jgi:hypothetical protein
VALLMVIVDGRRAGSDVNGARLRPIVVDFMRAWNR